MPRIYDNLENQLLTALQETLKVSHRADFCVGYFNLRGWCHLEKYIEPWPGSEDNQCRLLIGMQTLPQDELRAARSLSGPSSDGTAYGLIDQQTALRLKKKAAEEFRTQLTLGAPSNTDEASLRRLSAQLHARKLVVKLHLRHPLHAKLYLLYRHDYNNPITGFLGSSNLTFAGMKGQGELNVDVVEGDACLKLANWFEERWEDRWSLDISEELAEIIDTSWAREQLIPPYHIYLKMAYHLSHEARAGLAEYQIPAEFDKQLLEFQTAAVKIAANHVNKRGGVLIGDVVGLGKTLMATALASVFYEDQRMDTLIICPRNLVNMWENYINRYDLKTARVLSIGKVIRDLPKLPRYKLVLIDESHNLRNREGRRFKAITEYIEKNDSKCILLTATPYNKKYLDISSQLRLFVPENRDLGIRPEKLISQLGELEFIRRHQAGPRTLAAFEKSENIDDWRDLMRFFMVRRTRSFIQDNYALTDPTDGRKYLLFPDGRRSYFPKRLPRTLKYSIEANDPYARLYSEEVVSAVNRLRLPRYGLGSYVTSRPNPRPNPAEQRLLENLGRAGQRLMGFCRTNLFKRLESGGPAFLQSIERHILRNFVFLHAIENGLDLPLGTQDPEMLDAAAFDEDADAALPDQLDSDYEEDDTESEIAEALARRVESLSDETAYRRRAAEVYAEYATRFKRRFKWLRPSLFLNQLQTDLLSDARALLHVRTYCGYWQPTADAKLNRLLDLLTRLHPDQKILVFSQFADTVRYLVTQLKALGLTSVAGVTGDTDNPTALAWRFSPRSNNYQPAPGEELRVLISTDVLSEGQNLQDAAIVVNYDLPWAIIRLIQRAGRVDRIGQQSSDILCYSFLPAEGVESIIRLRSRVRQRLRENAEVVGTDETFFEEDADSQVIINLYNEKSGILDGEADNEIDLTSQAYQIWKNAIDADPTLKNIVSSLPDVVFSSRQHLDTGQQPYGVLLYLRTATGNDSLAWLDQNGQPVTQSQSAILDAAYCPPNTPAMPRHPSHHDLVERGVRFIAEEEKSVGGQLGRPGGARFRTFARLKAYSDLFTGTLFEPTEENQLLLRAVDQLYQFPLRQSATDTINRQLKSGIKDETLAQLVITLYQEDRLCVVPEEGKILEPKIICSLGLFP